MTFLVHWQTSSFKQAHQVRILLPPFHLTDENRPRTIQHATCPSESFQVLYIVLLHVTVDTHHILQSFWL